MKRGMIFLVVVAVILLTSIAFGLLPTTPTNILCNGGDNCNINVYDYIVLQSTGSVDPENDSISYFIEAYLDGYTCINSGNCQNCSDNLSCVDCNDSGCSWNSGSIQYTNLGFYGFESGEQGWTFGGTDANRISEGTLRPPPSQCDDTVCGNLGGFIVYIEGGSTTSNIERNFNFTGFNSVTLSFWSWEYGFEPGEYVRVLCDGNEIWRLTDGDYSQEQWLNFNVVINSSNCNFDDSVLVRFDGAPGLSGKNDNWYIDGINLVGVSSTSSGCEGTLDCLVLNETQCNLCSQCSWSPIGTWIEIGSHTEEGDFFWNTTGINQSCVNLRARASDGNYSDYFIKDSCLNLTGESGLMNKSFDVNFDGRVNILDLSIIVFNQKRSEAQGNMKGYRHLDLDDDLDIDWDDVLALMKNL